MVSAPVGWQCQKCLRGAPIVRSMRDISSGGAFSLTNAKPYATYTIIAICVAAFVAQQATDIGDRGDISAAGVDHGELWRLVTSGFLHVDPMHLLFNVTGLLMLGNTVEGRLGRVRFLGLYILSLVGGSIGVMLVQAPTAPAVGASGALFGLMGGVVVMTKRGRAPIDSAIWTLLGINLVFTFVFPGIAIGGHVGGLVAGAVGGLVLRVAGDGREPRRVVLTTLVLVALTLSLVAVAQPVAAWRCGDERLSTFDPHVEPNQPFDIVQVQEAMRRRAAQALLVCY